MTAAELPTQKSNKFELARWIMNALRNGQVQESQSISEKEDFSFAQVKNVSWNNF